MKVKIELTVDIGVFDTDDEVPGTKGLRMVHSILCVALGEFRSARTPARLYVDKRYPDTDDYSWLDRGKKIIEVKLRTRIAGEIKVQACNYNNYRVG